MKTYDSICITVKQLTEYTSQPEFIKNEPLSLGQIVERDWHEYLATITLDNFNEDV
jgi:hypothetical protein